jgi:hypothetical protein
MTPGDGDGVPPGDGGRGQDHNHSEGLCDSYAHQAHRRTRSLTMRERMLVDSARILVSQRLP